MKNKSISAPESATSIATITALSHDGRGIAKLPDGKTVFIRGALRDEVVTYKLTRRHSRFNEADAIAILTPSPAREAAACAHYSTCGGCSMQHIGMATQITLKQQVLLEQLQHFGKVSAEAILPPLSGPSLGYRRKARLGVRYISKKNKVVIGFREKSSALLTDIDVCAVLHPAVSQHLPALRELVTNLKQFQYIPQIEVAVGDGAAALVFRHLTALPAEDIEQLTAFGKHHGLHIYLQPNPPQQTHKLWPADSDLRLNYNLPEYALTMHFHPLDFIQVNGEANPLLIQSALQLLAVQPHETVLDLFCGLGNFTLPLARQASLVTGIEGSTEMVMRAGENAAINNITNTKFFAANLAELPRMQPGWMQMKYDKILLDPPRTGAKEILKLLPVFSAQKIVYVSCNPATLARDAGELVHQYGYTLKKIGVINMFPHTSHIEAIALFEKS